jgi:Holliday junction resolvase
MSKPILITKSHGQLEPFDEKKVRASIVRTGADKKVVDQVLDVVKKKLKPKMRTSDIYKLVNIELDKLKPWAAARYNLRDAIIKMGPTGFNFEKYVASILNAYGYDAITPDTYQGACISHEVDVTAKKEGRTAFIEAKFRHDYRGTVNIKDTMSTWARFLDLVDGAKVDLCPHFDEAWIVTNARFTDQSLKYGHCKNMVLIGWNHPRERTFAQMVDLNALYPVTLIKDLKKPELEALASENIMLCRDVIGHEIPKLTKKTGFSISRAENIIKSCEAIISGDKV